MRILLLAVAASSLALSGCGDEQAAGNMRWPRPDGLGQGIGQ